MTRFLVRVNETGADLRARMRNYLFSDTYQISVTTRPEYLHLFKEVLSRWAHPDIIPSDAYHRALVKVGFFDTAPDKILIEVVINPEDLDKLVRELDEKRLLGEDTPHTVATYPYSLIGRIAQFIRV